MFLVSPMKNFATEINAKLDERSKEIAKRMIANGKLPDEDIAECSGFSVEDVVVLRSQMCDIDKK